MHLKRRRTSLYILQTEDPFKIFSKNQTVLRKRREEKEVPSQGHSEREYLLKAIYKKDFLEVF